MSNTNHLPTFETNGIILGDYLRSVRPDLWDYQLNYTLVDGRPASPKRQSPGDLLLIVVVNVVLTIRLA